MQTYTLPDYDKLRMRALKCRKLAKASNRKQTRDELLRLANDFDKLASKINEMQARSAAVARTFKKER